MNADDHNRAYNFLDKKCVIRGIEPEKLDFDLSCWKCDEKILSKCIGFKEKLESEEIYFHSWCFEDEVKHLAKANKLQGS